MPAKRRGGQHQQRCEEGEPYTDSVTTEELRERIVFLVTRPVVMNGLRLIAVSDWE